MPSDVTISPTTHTIIRRRREPPRRDHLPFSVKYFKAMSHHPCEGRAELGAIETSLNGVKVRERRNRASRTRTLVVARTGPSTRSIPVRYSMRQSNTASRSMCSSPSCWNALERVPKVKRRSPSASRLMKL